LTILFIYVHISLLQKKTSVGLAEIQNDGAPASIPQKQKTSKAERRAIQEAQRAAKAATKEAGNYHS
jgi:translation initiation factor eIF-2B subunit delta